MAGSPANQQSLSELAAPKEGNRTTQAIDEATFLTEKQRELGQRAFETTVAPLREGFQERLGTAVEELGRRGVAFGGVGSQSLTDLLEAEQRAEAQIAGGIATQLGNTALQQAYAANEAAKARESMQEFQREEREFAQTFSREEREAIQGFQTAFQEAGFQNQFSLLEQQEASRRQDQVLQLFLSGNLSGESAQEAVQSILGDRLVLTNEDELRLQRAAANSGLTPEEYTNIRRAIGTEQQRVMLENPEEFILDPEKLREFQLQISRESNQAALDVARAQAGENKFGVEEASLGIFGGQIISGKVLCTELHRQRLLPRYILEADLRQARKYDYKTKLGYQWLAKPIVKMMRKSKMFTYALMPFIRGWAYKMAYKEGVHDRPNLIGYGMELVAIPVCNIVGRCLVSYRTRQFKKAMVNNYMEVFNYA